MSELRIKLLDLAIQGGATIENAQRVAADWERWATEDDPLRVGEPGPKWRHESEIPEGDYQRIHADLHGVDWSRPQMVVSKIDDTMIVRTTGEHIDDVFTGYGPWDGDVPESNYKKKHFRYHGEIEEPKNPGKTEQEIDWSRPQLVKSVFNSSEVVKTNGLHETTHNCKYPHFEGTVIENNGSGWEVGFFSKTWDKSAFVYYGEIPEGPSTTGINFLEAVQACKSGKNVCRKDWTNNHWYYSNDYIYDVDGDIVSFHLNDILATDWRIIEP